MEIIPEITMRRARRGFSVTPVPEDALHRVLEAALLAPSCANRQSWRFIALNEDEKLESVRPHLTEGNYWVKRSPCLVLALTRPELGCQSDDRREYALFDTGLACMNLMLQATREGLVAHPIAGFAPVGIKQVLAVPPEYILITIIALGLPGDKTLLNDKHRESEDGPRVRRPFDESVCFNSWKF